MVTKSSIIVCCLAACHSGIIFRNKTAESPLSKVDNRLVHSLAGTACGSPACLPRLGIFLQQRLGCILIGHEGVGISADKRGLDGNKLALAARHQH